MSQCVLSFIQTSINCCLPWLPDCGRFNPCSTNTQFLAFIAVLESLEGLGDRGFQNMTGCVPSCQIEEYSTQVKYTGKMDRALALHSGHE